MLLSLFGFLFHYTIELGPLYVHRAMACCLDILFLRLPIKIKSLLMILLSLLLEDLGLVF
jgi:hypothetical protein